MTSILDTLRRTVRYLCHLHHRCGYGIQSPYAYSMVRDVVYERGTYYAYAALDALVAATPQAALRPRDYRLLFRLANAAGVRHMAVWAAEAEEPLVTACVRAACHAAQKAAADEALQWAYINAAADTDAEALRRHLAEADRRADDGALVVVARPPQWLRREMGRRMPPRCRVAFTCTTCSSSRTSSGCKGSISASAISDGTIAQRSDIYCVSLPSTPPAGHTQTFPTLLSP